MEDRRLKALIEGAHPNDREDMLQEAELARLEGRNPYAAANKVRAREQRHRTREVAFTDMGWNHNGTQPPEV